jgi:ankyrin repeat protein
MPLSLATSNSYKAVVKLLLIQDNIDLNFKDKFKAILLLLTAEYRSKVVVKLLLIQNDINPNPLTIRIAIVGYHFYRLPNRHIRL